MKNKDSGIQVSIKKPENGKVFDPESPVEVLLSKPESIPEYTFRDVALLEGPDPQIRDDPQIRPDSQIRYFEIFGQKANIDQLYSLTEGNYSLTVMRFKVPPGPRVELEDIFPRKGKSKTEFPWGSATVTFTVGTIAAKGPSVQQPLPVTLTSPSFIGATLKDAVLVALVMRQEKLFETITKDLDSLKKSDTLSPSTSFTGLRAYEILDRCMDNAMLSSMTFVFDHEKVTEDLQRTYDLGETLQESSIRNGTLLTRILEEAKKKTAAYFNSLNKVAGSVDSMSEALLQRIPIVMTPYYEHLRRLRPGSPNIGGDPPHHQTVDQLWNADGDEWQYYCAQRLYTPALSELIWSYWHEEGMQVQTMAAINLRFQNKLHQPGPDRLASLNTSPLRPLSNLIWGYIQEEQRRLSVRRRNYEYDHHYGISLHGKAVLDFTPADSRKTFIRAFHRLLNICLSFYKQVDDNTVTADPFPVKNALRDVHLILAEGAHNQYGDLPWTARKEMLIEQYMLHLPEMREFLGGRSMIPYREPWMENVDTMKRLQDWTDVSIEQFNTLARVGEQILLTIRFGDWNDPSVQGNRAFAWAVMLRPWVQEYIHSYGAVTGVDLRDARQIDDTMPSVHLRRRLEAQTGKAA